LLTLSKQQAAVLAAKLEACADRVRKRKIKPPMALVEARDLGDLVAASSFAREECLADPGTIGTLSIGDIPIGTAEKRPLHAAQLWERWGTSARRGLLPPLFDVQVLRITPRGLLLRGFQVDTSNRPNTAQHAQEWWAVPIEKPGAA
jgi:hypothetical protein